VLEDRTLLTAIVVNNPTDTPVAGQIDLREAITQAVPYDTTTITFDPSVFGTPQTIQLDPNQGFLESTYWTNVTLTGPGANLLTIDGQGASRILTVPYSVTFVLSGVTLANGKAADGFGGAIENNGTLTVSDSLITGSSASRAGGGVYTFQHSLTLTDCTISSCSAGLYGGGHRQRRWVADNDLLHRCQQLVRLPGWRPLPVRHDHDE
jgi:hypothetical protein